MKAEYRKGCLQRNSVEREGYAGARSVVAWDNRERDDAAQDLLRQILVFELPCTERYARWCERSTAQIMGSLLLDLAVSVQLAVFFI